MVTVGLDDRHGVVAGGQIAELFAIAPDFAAVDRAGCGNGQKVSTAIGVRLDGGLLVQSLSVANCMYGGWLLTL